MYWNDIQNLSDRQFQRLTGVKRPVFDKMITIAQAHNKRKSKHPGRGKPPKLQLEDQLLMMLMYLNEHRTFFHIATTYGISEGQCCRIIRKLESILINNGTFHWGHGVMLQNIMKHNIEFNDTNKTSQSKN